MSRSMAPLAPVSGNVAGVSRAAQAGNGKTDAPGRRPKREVIDLCDSPRDIYNQRYRCYSFLAGGPAEGR